MGIWRGLAPRPHRIGSAPDPRFSFANERTFLAWNRTALALVGGGLAADQLLETGTTHGGRVIGVALIILGVVVGLGGFLRWRAAEVAMRRRLPLGRSRAAPAMFGLGISAFAMLSLVLLVIGSLR